MKTLSLFDYHLVSVNLSEKILYDSHQIKAYYTAQKYGVIGNSILIFRGPMKLTANEMVDMKDVLREKHLADVLISADDTLHFIIEEFDIQPPNIELQYYRLRLLTMCVVELLIERGIKVERKGRYLR